MSWANSYAIYLRKSRADLDAEARGEGETLKRHENMLLTLAKKNNYIIGKIYPEIVSGERIADRPEMQQLLEDVEDGKWLGVLVMEVERLARGDTMDQGIVAQAFKYSSTKIITPMKVYDPDNEFDEEYFEFGLFMSRREYKTINRRQQAGRIESAAEGNYIGNIPPYGYTRIQLDDKSWTLKPHPDQAPIVKMIFDLYANQNMGMGNICKKLNLLGIPTAKGALWSVATVSGIIQNPVYNGEIVWGRRPLKKSKRGGTIKKYRPEVPQDQWRRVKGKHDPLITTELFERAQMILKSKYHAPAPAGVIASSLAGLVRCEDCNRLMMRRPYPHGQEATLICVTPFCKNISSQFKIVEARILEGLRLWIEDYKNKLEEYRPENTPADDELFVTKKKLVSDIKKALKDLKKQSSNLHDLLERGVYTVEVFLERSNNLSNRIAEHEAALQLAQEDLANEEKRKIAKDAIIPKVEHVLSTYDSTQNPEERNQLLKSILAYAVYKKTVRGHWSRPESMHEFDLKLFPKLPKG